MANLNLNKVILGGRITKDPELKMSTGEVPVTSFSIAVKRRAGADGKEPQTDFIYCTAWRKNAEFICRYFRQGSNICVVGTIQTNKRKDRNGNSTVFTTVVVDEAYFVDSKNEAPAQQEDKRQKNEEPERRPIVFDDDSIFETVDDDTDLPF